MTKIAQNLTQKKPFIYFYYQFFNYYVFLIDGKKKVFQKVPKWERA